ncbi:MAG: pentapeptide repeat-containing protein [Gammaproteobacteria bacterium]|nr:pentapeptide repeat-containing protein [Gammaproteobacteria bacterium]
MKDLTSNNNFHDQSFNGLKFGQQRLAGKEFYDCIFKSCDFSAAVFYNCEFNNCQFIDCNLNNLEVNNVKFSDVEFIDCKVIGVNWTMAYWRGLALSSPLTFNQCMIDSCSFYGLNLEKIVIAGCRAHDVDFREANLKGANFSDTDLSHSLFNNTNLSAANFNQAKNYNINIKNNTVKNASFCRYEAVNLLTSLGINLID